MSCLKRPTVKDTPILMCGDMVRATLDDLKTNTRRIIKLPRWANPGAEIIELCDKDGMGQSAIDWPNVVCRDTGCLAEIKCPYGWRGDRLWVRERFALNMPVDQFTRGVAYYATDSGRCAPSIRWRPSIHMPRWASRLTLEITDVRVERLQDITDEGIIAEGVRYPVSQQGNPTIRVSGKCPPIAYLTKGDTPVSHSDLLRCHFASLWDSINGEGSWAVNPWVWVVAFRRVISLERIGA